MPQCLLPLGHHYYIVFCVILTGGLCKFFCMMSEGSRGEQTAKLLKRANEENEDSLEVAKRVKTEGEHTEDEKKYPKKKVVLLMAYSGKGYYGMQVHTVSCGPISV